MRVEEAHLPYSVGVVADFQAAPPATNLLIVENVNQVD
jgi:hypothetical protein